MLLYGRNLLPELALPLRAAHGGPADGKARLPRHIRPAHEKRGGDQPEQVHPRPVGQRKELFHQPYGEAVLGTGRATRSCISNCLTARLNLLFRQ